MDKSVLLDVADGVATVTLNRAEGANALDMKMGRELLEAALCCEADPPCVRWWLPGPASTSALAATCAAWPTRATRSAAT